MRLAGLHAAAAAVAIAARYAYPGSERRAVVVAVAPAHPVQRAGRPARVLTLKKPVTPGAVLGLGQPRRHDEAAGEQVPSYLAQAADELADA